MLIVIFMIGISAYSQPTVIKHAALTMDQMPVAGKQVNLMWVQGFNYTEAQTLSKSKMPMVGFVNEKNLIAPTEKEKREAIIGTWLDSGMEIGNGTFSSIPLGEAKSASWFIDDINYGDRVISRLVADYESVLRYFRYPDMNLDASPERIDSVNYFLNREGYIPVTATIRFEDEYFNTPYINSKIERDTMLVRYIGERYIEYIKETLDFYDYWKNKYLIQNPYTTNETQYYVFYGDQTYEQAGYEVPVTVSEAHGYGMLIAVSVKSGQI